MIVGGYGRTHLPEFVICYPLSLVIVRNYSNFLSQKSFHSKEHLQTFTTPLIFKLISMDINSQL